MITMAANVMRSRWVRTFLGALLLAALVWLFGPLLGIGSMHPLENDIVRMIVIAAIFVLWLIENLIHLLRARRKEKALVDGVAATAPDPNATASAEEVAALADRLKQALTALKRARIGGRSRGYLYQLPWYMFIGPPGAGKTTALVNCGLNFPLADTQAGEDRGPKAVQGVGGTRNCDWWFTDQAVLIDTAGRYTTQDSNSAVDAAAWTGFLKLLKQHRRRQPLNGVLVTIGLADLAALGDAERMAHARAIRRRIRELHDELGVRIPAYVLFTKVDLLSGFVEFFDGLGKEEREQVWGTTFPLDDGRDEAGTVALFAPEFDKLLDRLNDRMLERVQQEPDLQRRRLVYGFPQQLASLRGTVAEFLTEIFRPSRLEARPLLRGVYFTSGTQDGTPIDRLLGAMAGQFGLQRQAVAAFSGAGRSYFLARLMREVLFGEAGLVSRDPKVERRQRLVQIGAYSIAGLILIGLTGAWTASYLGNRAMIGDVHAAGAQYDAQYAALAKRGPQDTDLAALLPALATLRTMPGGYDDREKSTPLELTFGLYQGQKLSVAANDTYGRALNALLLPRLLARLETLMQTHRDKPDFLYETLKVYLILGRQGPLDRDLVEQWVGSDIAANYAGDDKTEQREALLAHLHALLQYPLASVPLNGPLVAQARAVLTRQPLADYIYNRLLRSAVVQSLPEWTIADNAGPAGARVFELRDGKPLNTGMPGIFTWNGYHTAFLPLLPAVTKDATEDAWVLGRQQKAGLVGSVAGMNQLRRDVLGLYLDDYTRRWDALLVDIALKPFATIAQGLDELYLLSAPESPLRDLLQAANAQTQLSRPAAVEQAAGQAEAKVAKVGQKLTGFGTYLARSGMTFEQLQVGSIVAEAFGSDPAGKPIDPATRVDEHFKGFNDFVSGGKDKPGDLEAVIVKIQQIYQGLNQAANAANPGQVLLGNLATGGGAGGGGSPAAQLADIAQAPGVPKPVAAMLQTVSQSSSQVTANGASQQLADAWGSKVVPLCRDAFNRYPFIDSAQDVPLDDFTHLLGPGGLMDQFFEQYLKSFVDTSQEPWRWQSGDHTKLGVSPTSLPEFQRAADIRDALFPAGGSKVLVKFHLEPIGMDPGLSQISIEIGTDERMAYAQGPKQDTAMLWPANDGATQIRVTMTPSGGGEGVVNTYEGPWALLRMLQAAQPTQTGALDVVDVTFASPAGKAYFKLTAGSVHNPFTLPALRTFRCPPKL